MAFRTLDIEQIRTGLASWELDLDLDPVQLAPLEGGMNSECWAVETGAGRFVAKAARDASFRAGLEVAEFLEEHGFPAGGPLRTRAGELAVSIGDFALALLRFFPGRHPDIERPDDLRLWGDTMGRLHAVLAEIRHPLPGLPRWPRGFLRADAPFLDLEAWVRPAVVDALAEAHAVKQVSDGVVHGDAAPPFVDEASGCVAVIDWGAAMWGPLLYDVSSARFYFQSRGKRDPKEFEPFLAAYLASGPLEADEVRRGLEVFLRLRVAVQAFYFSWRLAKDVRLGIDDPAENRKGLEGARRAWRALEL